MIKNNISSLSVLAGLLGVSMIRKRKFSSKNEAHDSIMDVTVRFKVNYTLRNMQGNFEYNKKDYERILFEEEFFSSYKAYLEVNDAIYFNPFNYPNLDDEDEEEIKKEYLHILEQHPNIGWRFLDRVEYRIEDWYDIDGLNYFGSPSSMITNVEIIEKNEETYVDISYSYDLPHFYAFMNSYKDIKKGVLTKFEHFENDMVNLIGMYYVEPDIEVIVDGQELEADISNIGFTVISTDVKIHTDRLSTRDQIAISKMLSQSELRKF